MRWISALMW